MDAENVAKGERVAELWRDHRSDVMDALRSRGVTGDDAKDLCIVVFEKAMRKNEEGFVPIRNGWVGWLRVTARNLAVDSKRHDARRAKNGLGSAVLHDDGNMVVLDRIADESEPEAIDAEGKAILLNALSRLPVEKREVIVMHLWGEMKFSMIAALLGESISVILGRYFSGIRMLRKDGTLSKLGLCSFHSDKR